MPWDKANPPAVAKNWTEEEQAKCVAAANEALKDTGDEEQALYACIAAAGKSKNASRAFARADAIEFEAFAVGLWNGMTFARADLEQIAANFAALEPYHKVPLKLGHNDRQPLTDGYPALGWVTKAWVGAGDKLMLRAEHVPELVQKAIRTKLYRKVSIELDLGVEHKGKKYAYVLSGVALLGADLPAVNTLADLDHYIGGESRLAASRRSVFAAIDGSVTNSKEDDMSVTKEEMQKMIGDSLTAAVKPLNDAITERDAQIATFTKEKQDRENAERAAKVRANREAGTKVLEDAVKANAITPAQREAFSRSVGLADDARCAELDLDALKAMVGTTRSGDARFTDQGRREGGYERKEKSADAEIARLAREEQATNKVGYTEAQRRVFQRHPELAKEWLDGSAA